MSKVTKKIVAVVSIILVVGSFCSAQENFAEKVGRVQVGDCKLTTPINLPTITFGADIATFYANGGKQTKSGSIFDKQGLKFQIYVQDNPYQQARDYMEGKTPFFRGTYRMCALASELFNSDPRTKPYMVTQLTWSLGDHAVGRERIKTIADFKGAKVCLQAGGPHVGFLYDILKRANLTYNEITIAWAKNLMGPDSPADIFRKDSSIDIAFVITPDMIGLTGGLQNTGSGAEGTVKGARVVVSTSEMNYSIADVYLVRKDFWDKHSDVVTNFVAGLLKAQEEVIDLKKTYVSSGSRTYMDLLQLTQDIYGKEAVPTLEEDAHGMVLDFTFAGYVGQKAFFDDKNNTHGFGVFLNDAMDLAVSRGYVKSRQGIFSSPLNWSSSAFVDYLTKTNVTRGERFKAEAVVQEIEALSTGGALDENTILSFSINFQPNQIDFSEQQYATEYQRVVDAISKFGNAVIAIRGHADPTKMLLETIRAGMAKSIIKRSGSSGNYTYSLEGRPLNLEATKQIVALIEAGKFDGVSEHNPREVIQAANNLSRKRAEAVRDSVIKFAKSKNITLDASQIQPIGAGVREPFIAKPSNAAEANQNMRVEFRIVRVTAEAMKESDFDF